MYMYFICKILHSKASSVIFFKSVYFRSRCRQLKGTLTSSSPLTLVVNVYIRWICVTLFNSSLRVSRFPPRKWISAFFRVASFMALVSFSEHFSWKSCPKMAGFVVNFQEGKTTTIKKLHKKRLKFKSTETKIVKIVKLKLLDLFYNRV